VLTESVVCYIECNTKKTSLSLDLLFFRVIKLHVGFVKVSYSGLKKNTQQLVTLFALSNLWMVRGKLMQM